MAADHHIGSGGDHTLELTYDPSLVIPRLPPPTGPGAMTRRPRRPSRARRAVRGATGSAAALLTAAGLLSIGASVANEYGSTIASATVGGLYGDDVTGDPLATRRAGPVAPAESFDPTVAAEPEVSVERPEPVGIQISSIDVSRFPIRSVGLTDDGALEVPDETEIGWYRYGATAGSPGATVLAAHVAWNGETGPFFELGRLEPGATIEVTLDDGSTRHYEVVERALYGKTELPRERIWRQTGDETLVLITCGGEFNPEIRRFRQNIVVYATPIG